MARIYIDVTQPLRWGPHPPVGIPRVEFAIARYAFHQSDIPVAFFTVDRSGCSRLLNAQEQAYLAALVDQTIPVIGQGDHRKTFLGRALVILRSMHAGAWIADREFDRISAASLAKASDRRGVVYNLAKVSIRAIKAVYGGVFSRRNQNVDPLLDPNAECFLSFIGIHEISRKRRSVPVKAKITTILHDLILLEYPQFADPWRAKKFSADIAWMFSQCRKIVCVSASTLDSGRAYLTHARNSPPASLSVCRLGSFLLTSMESRTSEPVEHLEPGRFALYCSTIEIRKNHITLLRVWLALMPVLKDSLPTLVCCGRWGWMVDEVTDFLKAHPEVRQKVVFLSGVTDPKLAWLYSHARFGLYPSVAEGWGLGAAESLDFGLPILISDAPALAEATQNLMPVTPADDLDAWCDIVSRAALDDVWLQKLKDTISLRYKPITEAAFADTFLKILTQP